jgi:hypothetical protein
MAVDRGGSLEARKRPIRKHKRAAARKREAMRKRDELTNSNGCMFRAADDEMTFVLLGRDVAAPATIRAWTAERIRLGKNLASDPQIQEALDCANTMELERGTVASKEVELNPKTFPEACAIYEKLLAEKFALERKLAEAVAQIAALTNDKARLIYIITGIRRQIGLPDQSHPADVMSCTAAGAEVQHAFAALTKQVAGKGFEEFLAMKHRAETAEAERATLRALVRDYEEVNQEKKRLARLIDVAMHGIANAAPQPSLCDLVSPALALRLRTESAESELAALREDAWPKEMPEALRHILGLTCLQFIHPANAYRKAGFDIKTRAEEEQAFFLHRFIGFWFKYGDKWNEAAKAELKEVRERILAATQ